MSEPKHHHVVPKFLLERFARDGGLELVDRDDYSKVFRSNARHALATNDFYTVETDEGRDTLVEKLFAEHVEGPAAEAIRRLVDQGRLIGGQGIRGPIALLIAFQRVRGPGMRHAMVEHSKAITRKLATMATPSMIAKSAQERGDEMTEEDAAETVDFAKNGNYEIVIERAANLHLGSALRSALEIVPHLESRTWRLLHFADPVLMTCDEPVALVGRDARAPGGASGPARARAVAFPFDPRHALLMLRPDSGFDQGRAAGTAEDAEIINTHVAFHAHRFVVRHPGTDPLRGLNVPKKAPPVFAFGDMIAISPNQSVTERTKYLEKVATGKIQFTKAPDDDPSTL